MQEREEWLSDIQSLRVKERKMYDETIKLKADLDKTVAELDTLRARNNLLETDNATLTEQNIQVLQASSLTAILKDRISYSAQIVCFCF